MTKTDHAPSDAEREEFVAALHLYHIVVQLHYVVKQHLQDV
jgi:hypothetical protein